MSQSQTLEDPSVDESVVERAREYHQRSDGRFVEGRVAEIRDRSRGDGVMITVDTPMNSFTDHFPNPSPENNALEQVAEEYGTGLVDLRDLKGETVWCKKENGSWDIVIRQNRYWEKFNRLRKTFMDIDYLPRILIVLFSPIIAIDTKIQQGNHNNHPRLYEKPDDTQLWWSNGVLMATATFLTLLTAFITLWSLV